MRTRQPRRRQRQTRLRSSSGSQPWLLWSIAGTTVAVVIVIAVLAASGVFGGGSSDGSVVGEDALLAGGHILGEESAPVTLVEFADFQCPYCQGFWATTLPQIKQEFVDTGQARLVFRDYAFIGPESILAAEGAECAADQGKFFEFHDLLYRNQPSKENSGAITVDSLAGFAAVADMDVTAFRSCVSSHKNRQKVVQSTNSAAEAGVNSTPTLFINGTEATNPFDLSEIRSKINAALSGT